MKSKSTSGGILIGVTALLLIAVMLMRPIMIVDATGTWSLVQLTAPGRIHCDKAQLCCDDAVTAMTAGNIAVQSFNDHWDGTTEPQRVMTSVMDCKTSELVAGLCPLSHNTWVLPGAGPPTVRGFTNTLATDSCDIGWSKLTSSGSDNITFCRDAKDASGIENFGGATTELASTQLTIGPDVWLGVNDLSSSTSHNVVGLTDVGANDSVVVVFGSQSALSTITPAAYSANLYADVHFNTAVALNQSSGAAPNEIIGASAGMAGCSISFRDDFTPPPGPTFTFGVARSQQTHSQHAVR